MHIPLIWLRIFTCDSSIPITFVLKAVIWLLKAFTTEFENGTLQLPPRLPSSNPLVLKIETLLDCLQKSSVRLASMQRCTPGAFVELQRPET